MSKLQYTLSSLVAAVPAAVLAWMMTLAFVNHFENMTMAAQVVAGLTLAVCVVLVAVPVYVLFVWSPEGAASGVVERDAPDASAGFAEDDFAAGEPLVDDEDVGFDEDADAGEWDEGGDEWDDADEEWEDEDELR